MNVRSFVTPCSVDVFEFDVGKSVHHHTIQINQLTRYNSFTDLLLDVLCRSTCFGRLHAHHQELTTALRASGFTLERGGSSVVSRSLETTTNNAAITTLQDKTRGC